MPAARRRRPPVVSNAVTAFTGVAPLDDVLARLAAARSRDEHDDRAGELAKIAPRYLEEIDRLFDAGTYYRMSLIWSLIGETSPRAVALFEKAIADKDPYTRWAAAKALACCRSSRASGLLVAALKDRSHFVKGTAVDAMAMASLRNPDAIPQLEKIIASEHLRRSAPGIVRAAHKALAACRAKVIGSR